jgi:hypothetical protein
MSTVNHERLVYHPNLLGREVALRYYEDLLLLVHNAGGVWRGVAPVYRSFLTWEQIQAEGGWEKFVDGFIAHVNAQLLELIGQGTVPPPPPAPPQVSSVNEMLAWMAAHLEFAVVDGKPVLRRK